MASPLFSISPGSGGPAIGPDLTPISGYIGSGNTSASNLVADALAASGLTGGTIIFPNDAQAHNTVGYLYKAQFVSVSDNFSIQIRRADGSAWGEISTNIDGAGATFYGTEGGYQLEVSINSTSFSLNDIAQAFAAQLGNMNMSTIDLPAGADYVIYGADEGGINPPPPTVNGSLSLIQTQVSGAVRRASVQTLMDRGWSVANAT